MKRSTHLREDNIISAFLIRKTLIKESLFSLLHVSLTKSIESNWILWR